MNKGFLTASGIFAVLVLGWLVSPKQPVELVAKSYSCSKSECKVKAEVKNLTGDLVKAVLQVKAIDVVVHGTAGAQTNKVMVTNNIRFTIKGDETRTVEAAFKVYDKPDRLNWFVGKDIESD